MRDLVEAQRRFFNSGKTKDVSFRISMLARLKAVIDKNEAQILSALKKDLGKCDFEGYTSEISMVMGEIDFMLKNIRKLSKPKKVKTPKLYMGASSMIIPEPYGVVLVIGPWNYPFQLALGPLVGAIAAGNCAVVKPSELSSNVSSLICSLINDNFDREYLSVVEGGIDASTRLLDQKFDYIFFTGGTAVGKIVMSAAAKNLTPVTLELGGKCPCIIDDNINMQYAARRIAWGKFMNAGQTCVAPDYIFVRDTVKDGFLKTLTDTIRQFYGDDPQKSGHYGRIISARHFNRLLQLLDDGNILCGGKHSAEELYISPTVIDGVSPDSRIMEDEIFGPILPVMKYSSLDEVVRFINSRPKPLALYFFSNNRENIKQVLSGTSSGGVSINDTISHISTSYLPFGGVGESGMGSYHGRASFEIFTHMKSVLKNHLAFDFRLRYPPYNVSVNFIKKALKLLLK